MREKAGLAIKAHRSSPDSKIGGKSNMFESILQNDSIPASEKQQNRIAQEGFGAIGAGGETLSRTLAATIFFVLAAKDSVLQRIREELLTVIPGPESRPDLNALEKLPFYVSVGIEERATHAYDKQTAVIKESLRCAPLLASRLPLVAPQEKLRYQKWEIPAGVS